MPDRTDIQPSWKRFENHPGPDLKEEHAALARWNAEKGAMYRGSRQSGVMSWLGTPRKAKYNRQMRP